MINVLITSEQYTFQCIHFKSSNSLWYFNAGIHRGGGPDWFSLFNTTINCTIVDVLPTEVVGNISCEISFEIQNKRLNIQSAKKQRHAT